MCSGIYNRSENRQGKCKGMKCDFPPVHTLLKYHSFFVSAIATTMQAMCLVLPLHL